MFDFVDKMLKMEKILNIEFETMNMKGKELDFFANRGKKVGN